MNCLRKGSRIVDGEVIDERSVIDPRPPFGGVELIGVRSTTAIEPELLVITDGVDDERVSFPVTDGVAPPGWEKIIRVLGLIHVHDAMVPGVAGLMQKINLRQTLRRVRHREFPWIRVHSWHAHGQAS